MATVEDPMPFTTFDNDQVRMYYSYDDQTRRLDSLRGVNDGDLYCRVTCTYHGTVFSDLLGPHSSKRWPQTGSLPPPYRNWDIDDMSFGGECSRQPIS